MEIPLWTKIRLDRTVTERDQTVLFRGAPEVGPDASSGAGTIVNRLSSLSSVDCYYSFVRVRHFDVTKVV